MNNNISYAEFDESQYTAFRKNLIKSKGSRNQIEFLEAVHNTKEFIAYMEDVANVAITEGESFPLFEENLTENEFKELPEDIEHNMFTLWENLITPKIACRTSLWAKVTVDHTKAKKIEASYLAANGNSGNESKGKSRIDGAIKSNNDQKIDDVVRTTLRRLGGLPEARGNRTIYVDCPFSRAWWRGYILREVYSEDKSSDRKKLSSVLRRNQTYWEKLITLTVSKNSVLGDSKVRSALIICLADNEIDAKRLNHLSRMIGTRQAIQELGVLEINDLKNLISNELIPQIG